MDIDELLEDYTSLLENGDDVQLEPDSVVDEFCDPMFDDIEDSLFYKRQESPCQDVNDAPVFYAQELVCEDAHEDAKITDTFDGHNEAMKTMSKHML